MMIDDKSGKIYIIDFGYAVRQTREHIKRYGPYSNFQLLANINHAIKYVEKMTYFYRCVAYWQLNFTYIYINLLS